MPKKEKKAAEVDSECWKTSGMTFVPHSLAAQFPNQLPN